MKDTYYDVKFITRQITPIILEKIQEDYNIQAHTVKEAIAIANDSIKEEIITMIKNIIVEYTSLYLDTH
ncbi:MAG: hypothetical protein ACLTDM_07360 [Clostridium butyricum]